MPGTGIVVRPGAIITLYADISNYGRGVRNVAFQPALLTRSGGSLTSEVLPLFTWENGVPPRL